MAIEALGDGRKIAEIAQTHDVHPNPITQSALVGFPINGYLEKPRNYGATSRCAITWSSVA